MKTTSTRRARRRGWWLGPAVAVIAVLAAGCVRDLTAELGGLELPTVLNDDGVMAGEDIHGDIVRYERDGSRVTLPHTRDWSVTLVDITNEREVLAQGIDYRPDLVRPYQIPLVWNAAGELLDLRPLIPGAGAPGTSAVATDINEHGLVVGHLSGEDVTTSPPTPLSGMFAVDIREMRAVAITPEVAGERPLIEAVNDDGVIVGLGHSGGGRWRPSGDGYVFEGLGGFFPDDINNAGDMVGTDIFAGPSVWRANAEAPALLPETGLTEEDLLLDGWISNSGVIVFNGQSSATPSVRRPVRWKPGLDPEVFPVANWVNIQVMGLNGKGSAILTAYRDDYSAEHSLRWD